MDQNEVTLWQVTWHVAGEYKIRTSLCSIGATSNKITTLDDVPVILAIANGQIASEVVLIALVRQQLDEPAREIGWCDHCAAVVTEIHPCKSK